MAKSSAEKGREVPNQSEQRETKKSFKGNERTIGWSLKQVETGQFIQFTYKSKQRRVLVLTPDWRNVKENSRVIGIPAREF